MNTLESLQYAKARLALAKMVGETPEEIAKWQEHVTYWQDLLQKEDEARRQDSMKSYGAGNAATWGYVMYPTR